ncbi:MAG: LacI family DNA-binding transcriptional regulator [Sphingobacteriaceae bacterium]
MKRLQLEDLSRELGYSKTLISMVLNGKGNQYGISKKTQAAVLDAVAQMDYSPNKFARALRTGKSFFIGLIVADIGNPFYSKIAKNIETVLFSKGYNLMVCSTEENVEKEKKLVDMMINQQGVDGLIIASSCDNADFYNSPRFSKTPIVFIDRVIPLFNANYIVIDNYGGSMEVVNKLVDEDCKNIACLSITPSYISTIEDRLNGYKGALQKNKLALDQNMIVNVNFDNIYEDVVSALRKYMNANTKIDAIYSLNNHLAVAALKAIKENKDLRSYFDKTKMACFDDVELFNLIDKPVLSVSQPIESIGQNASNLVMDIIDGKHSGHSNIVLPTNLIQR